MTCHFKVLFFFFIADYIDLNPIVVSEELAALPEELKIQFRELSVDNKMIGEGELFLNLKLLHYVCTCIFEVLFCHNCEVLKLDYFWIFIFTGEFGSVYKAVYRNDAVAVKFLKG